MAEDGQAQDSQSLVGTAAPNKWREVRGAENPRQNSLLLALISLAAAVQLTSWPTGGKLLPYLLADSDPCPYLSFLKKVLSIFRERGREGESEGEKH